MFEHMLEHRLMNRPKIALLISKENFAGLDFARFQGRSIAIGRFFSPCRRLIDTRSSKKGSGANGRIWRAMMSAELPEGWAWAS
jgi:hypothetical protein